MAISEAARVESPFHEGEQRVQERLGVREKIEPWARKVVRAYLPHEHREFYQSLPFLVAAARDERGRPWATVLSGAPGFIESPDDTTLAIGARPVAGDALEHAFTPNADVGFLGIELEHARRNRVNGRVQDASPGGFTFHTDQTFGNCPQYIHDRRWQMVEPDPAPRRVRSTLSKDARRLIENADTFFIASGHRGEGKSPTFGMDASHRGGEAGFVHVLGERHLVFPDYQGNNHFNTIGNLMLDPRAGFLFVDFETGSLLQLTGTATIDWESDELKRFPGARRLVHLEIEETIELDGALPIRWQVPQQEWTALAVVEKVHESADVTSFLFEPVDGSTPPTFVAGNHLPIRLSIPGQPDAVARTYSLSVGPGAPHYRISVKREELGLASRYLHDAIDVGHVVEARAPRGDFTLPNQPERPIALVSAGVGVTPMVSMLQALTERNDPTPVWFVHGARDAEHHPLRREVEALVDANPRATLHVSYTRPHRQNHRASTASAGRIDAERLSQLIPDLEADFYLCGPPQFLADLQSGLEARGVPQDRIHSESF